MALSTLCKFDDVLNIVFEYTKTDKFKDTMKLLIEFS